MGQTDKNKIDAENKENELRYGGILFPLQEMVDSADKRQLIFLIENMADLICCGTDRLRHLDTFR